jgi:NAD(P)-dependent dehydrogenase (short-subunit alcohol dehydrogenase family)
VENSSSQFIKCDVTNWDDQVRAFEAAVKNSPHKSCDVVIANAGVVGQDDMFTLEGEAFAPRQV